MRCWMCIGFFFFKQKTAYEMRISDWSSDVCSSDLSVEDVERRGGCGEDLPVIHRINELAGERDRIARGGGFHGILITRPERGDLAVELVLGDAIFAEQIGRASRRERVCQ